MKIDLRGTDFVRRHNEHRMAVRNQSESTFSDLIEIRSIILDQIDAYHMRVQGVPFNGNVESHYLLAQFFQGIDLSYSAIIDGLYAQAAALQKQQIETLTALGELSNGRRHDGRTPNVGNALPGFKAEYNNLNDVAHPGRKDIIENLGRHKDGDKVGPTSIPQFQSTVCKAMLLNHCVYLLHCWRFMTLNFRPSFSEKPLPSEENALRGAIDRLNTALGSYG